MFARGVNCSFLGSISSETADGGSRGVANRQSAQCRLMAAWLPVFAERPQIDRATDHCPLCVDSFQPSHGPTPKSFVLFDLRKHPLNNLSAFAQMLGGLRLSGARSHLLHGDGVRPNLYKPSRSPFFGAGRAHRWGRLGQAVRAGVSERLGGDASPYLGLVAEDGGVVGERINERVWREERLAILAEFGGTQTEAGPVEDTSGRIDRGLP